jgi:hypothetical protein
MDNWCEILIFLTAVAIFIKKLIDGYNNLYGRK